MRKAIPAASYGAGKMQPDLDFSAPVLRTLSLAGVQLILWHQAGNYLGSTDNKHAIKRSYLPGIGFEDVDNHCHKPQK